MQRTGGDGNRPLIVLTLCRKGQSSITRPRRLLARRICGRLCLRRCRWVAGQSCSCRTSWASLGSNGRPPVRSSLRCPEDSSGVRPCTRWSTLPH